MDEKYFKSSRPRLLVLSDLWGNAGAEWINRYLENLKDTFDIKVYDSCKLAQVDIQDYNQENLHRQFVEGGIERAVKNLCKLEREKVNVIAFSIGGVIAWKANLLSLDVENLYSLSSTRLRKETTVPDSKIKLHFGDQDLYQPKKKWYKDKNVEVQILKNIGHDLYKIPKYIDQISQDIVLEFNSFKKLKRPL